MIQTFKFLFHRSLTYIGSCPIEKARCTARLSQNVSSRYASSSQNSDSNKISITFLKADGTKTTVKSTEGKSLYDAVIDNNVDIDGFGACEGTLCCTTCHLYFSETDFKKVGEPNDEELDMLDLAYNLTETSRLGCQVKLSKKLDPLEVHVPAGINDVREA